MIGKECGISGEKFFTKWSFYMLLGGWREALHLPIFYIIPSILRISGVFDHQDFL